MRPIVIMKSPWTSVHHLLTAFLFLVSITGSACGGDSVVSLTDATFEHQTQV